MIPRKTTVVIAEFRQRGIKSDFYAEVPDSESPVRGENVFSQISIERSLQDDHEEPVQKFRITIEPLDEVVDKEPTSWYGIICPKHGHQGLSLKEYQAQMSRPNNLWRCPIQPCDETVHWDDDRYEEGPITTKS